MVGRPLGDFTQTLTIAQAYRAATVDHIAMSGPSLKITFWDLQLTIGYFVVRSGSHLSDCLKKWAYT